jgi:hypothetical protein
MGALSWLVEDGRADDVDLSGLGVVLALRYDDDEPGSPWDHWLFVDERSTGEQRDALEAIFLGRLGGSAADHFPWAWKASRLLGVSAAEISFDHTSTRGWFRVRDQVTIRVRGDVPDQAPVTCVIPGHDRDGAEVVVDELHVSTPSWLAFDFEGTCGYRSTFDYAGP